MTLHIAVIDYGLGNLHSVCKALRMLEAPFQVTDDPGELEAATHIILPGVGAFGDGMKGLRQRGHDEALRENATRGVPILGICLGAQLLLEQSSEFGTQEGLGIIPGQVEPIPHQGGAKVPHVGWQKISAPAPGRWSGSLLQQTPDLTYTYFVHSFHAMPTNKEDLLAVTRYGENTVTAGVRRGSVTGLQFHPEKSGQPGLDMIKTFLREQKL
jgi:glutamine amidotransferase